MRIRYLALAAALAPLAACNSSDSPSSQSGDQVAASPYADLQFEDAPAGDAQFTAPESLGTEVMLDRLGFSSGVIDGKSTRFDTQAIRAFQQAQGLNESGTLDDATRAALAKFQVPATRMVRIPARFAQGPFMPDLPEDTAEQAKVDRLGYRNLMEALAERFHTTPETLVALNSPQTGVGAGAVIRVPNTAPVDPAAFDVDDGDWNTTLMSLGIAPDQPAAARVVVDKSDGVLRAFDEEDRLIAQFPATMGSEHDPLPIGKWTIKGVSHNPPFHYNPDLFWDVSDSADSQVLPPGPNGPVGVVWIDLSKEHYGIHGTGEPASIGTAQSHGCVRLTNWDAARLAQMVKPNTPAVFQE
ncbi:murein L,D-transpeptidase [Altererythrobacter sp. B11]|uniref:L,D-transpeptidase family protein n=1 Tax=Altererythrobacter sp. B11 TaxID=2060312 RepID=UPI000DC6FD18|nr:L,D-transpeptidase family protein [Altererythrobacter sp. B11]BBC74370.1 murein L,D-transpeptidase [Altererythrobacter sp. B11]